MAEEGAFWRCSPALPPEDKTSLAILDSESWYQKPDLVEKVRDPLLRAAAIYFLHGRNSRGTPVDSVARFHLGNGARLERINFLADKSVKGLDQSHGLMVNYLYDPSYIERNHEGYANRREIAASPAISRLAS